MDKNQKKFQRRIENFVCDRCGFHVKGNGYTDHCPQCLWGKHVDINPGDRAENCRGLMKPISVEKTKKGFDVVYRCERCSKKRRNKSGTKDDFNVLVNISEFASNLNR